MTEEMIQDIKKEETKCFCKSEGFKNFIVVATGTFVGVFCAISLFAALHAPKHMMPVRPHFPQPCIIQNINTYPPKGIQNAHYKWHKVKPHHNFDAPRHHKNFDGQKHYRDFDKKPHPKFDGKKVRKFENNPNRPMKPIKKENPNNQ